MKLFISSLFAYLISCISVNGQVYNWTKTFGGIHDDRGYSICSDPSGNIYSTGYFSNTTDFDPGASVLNLSSLGGPDIFIQKLDAAGNLLWVKSIGGPSNDEAFSIDTDIFGNVYTVGYFGDTVDFDPGLGIDIHTSQGVRDAFILKMDSVGNFIWAKTFGGSGVFDHAQSIAIDSLGNVYTSGFFSDTVDFNPGAGIFNLTSVGYSDIFIQKLDATGNFIWAKTFGGNNAETAEGIEIDLLGNIYITGYFKDTVDFDPGLGETKLVATGFYDIFIQKIDSQGNFIWAKSFGGFGNDYSISTTTDAFDNVYTTGSFSGNIDLNPGTGIANFNSFNGDDVFIQKLDASGNFLWANSFGGNSNCFGSEILVDASNNIYTIGFFEGTVDFDPSPAMNNYSSVGQSDIFIHKMSQVTTNLSKLGSKIKVLVSPNPTTGNITIFSEVPQSQTQIELYDSQSRMVFSKEIIGDLNEQINIAGSSGIYFVKIMTSNSQSVIKIIKK